MGNICWGITSFGVKDEIQSDPRNWSQNGAHPLIWFFRIVNSFTRYGKSGRHLSLINRAVWVLTGNFNSFFSLDFSSPFTDNRRALLCQDMGRTLPTQPKQCNDVNIITCFSNKELWFFLSIWPGTILHWQYKKEPFYQNQERTLFKVMLFSGNNVGDTN